MQAEYESPLPCAPVVDTLTRLMLPCQQNTSRLALVSLPTRSLATLSNAITEPLSETLGENEPPLAATPCALKLMRNGAPPG